MSLSYKITYNQSRFPNQPKRPDGSWGCRGCGGAIPKGRSAWCSKACCEKFHPAFVISNVRKRDKDICVFCGFDIRKAEDQWFKEKPDYMKVGWEGHQAWMRQRPIPNYDHIVAFSEGGLTVLENMRTLCEPCHKKRTKEWHSERKKRCLSPEIEKAEEMQLNLI